MGLDDFNDSNTAFFQLIFGTDTAATAGNVEFDFWEIGDNIGYGDLLYSDMMGTTGRGAFGGSSALSYSGKGLVQTRHNTADNGYSLNFVVAPSATVDQDVDIDGSEWLTEQTTHVWVKFTDVSTDINFSHNVGWKSNGRGGIVSENIKVSTGPGAFGPPGLNNYMPIPIFGRNATNNKMFIRLFGTNNHFANQTFTIDYKIMIMAVA